MKYNNYFIYLKELIDKVRYFTFNPIFYNMRYLEDSSKKSKEIFLV